ncbi:MAG: 23S rRNA (uracil(1939)-C(5))-methyltransferase RlmD [Clostridia bacterium]|nr:23S rRNA (uracil(1939)-C(5))-methyltransferase RlmD [Clostridia bacterium]
MIAKNQKYEIKIEDLNNLGYGVGRIGDTVAFVSGAVDGDLVLAKVILVKKNYVVAKAEKIIEPSPYRASESFCSSVGCGGCAYADITYERELELKRERVEMAFRKARLPEVEIKEVFSTHKIKHYRNKAQYPITRDKNGEYKIGFFAPKSHRVVEAINCSLQPKLFSEILVFLKEWFCKHDISTYDEESKKGLLRHIYLRCSKDEKDVSLVLVVNGKSIPRYKEFVKEIVERFPMISSVMLNVNTLDTNVICTDEYIALYGKGYIEDTLCGVNLKISPASFYQVNHDIAEAIYKKAASLADLKGDECLLDLYSGIGSIGLSMAKRVKEVIGVEVVEDAVLCAEENAKRNGIENASFFCADASETENIVEALERVAKRKISPDVVILDPPRKGSSPELLDYLANTSLQKIVYVSCNPDTLARDAGILIEKGFKISEVYPFDMFPRTGHVESVVCLTRE